MHTRIIELKRDNVLLSIIGTAHIGTSEYYNLIQNYIDNRDSVVLYEGVSKGVFNTKELDLNLIYETFASMADLKLQKSCMLYKDSWINSDIPFDMVNVIDPSTMDKLFDIDVAKFLSIASNKNVKKLTKVLLNIYPSWMNINTSVCTIRNYTPVLDAVRLISAGNTDISILYGEGHVNGIVKALKSMGFVVTKTIRVKAW